LMDDYSQFGNIRVRLVSFAQAATDEGGAWLTLSQAKTVLDNVSAVRGDSGGLTNYDAAIAAATAAFDTTGRLTSAQTVAYFLSDGVPNRPANQEGLNATEETAWKAFLNTNEITSYAIGITDDVGKSYLDPIAWNGSPAGGSSADAIVVTNLTQLKSVLQNTVPIPSGELSAGGAFGAGGQIGADFGHVQSVTVDGITYTYLATNDSSNPIAVTGGIGSYKFIVDTRTLEIKTLAGGTFSIALTDGLYEYRVPNTLVTAVQTEVLSTSSQTRTAIPSMRRSWSMWVPRPRPSSITRTSPPPPT
jgi:von Willebrand factor type A domain